jgi:hypothetical protein
VLASVERNAASAIHSPRFSRLHAPRTNTGTPLKAALPEREIVEYAAR